MTDKIINRVKKMMALANDPAASDGERENALRMSYAIMAKYNLDMNDVDGKPMGPQELRQGISSEYYARPWAVALCSSIGKLFFCKYYFSRRGKDQAAHTFVGKESNAATADEVAKTLVASIRFESNRRMRQAGENATWRRSFATGAALKIQERVNELLAGKTIDGVSNSGQLMLINLRESEAQANQLFTQSQGIALKTGKARNFNNVRSDAYAAGRSYGGGLSLAASKKIN